MLIEIESYKGDTLLYGKSVSHKLLATQLSTIEELHDKGTDNFIPLLCRMYQWSVTSIPDTPEYIYDRDTLKLLKTNN